MEIYALHLPAFHRIKENDEWWGEGFTEWDNVRKGRPLFKGHIQPKIPLGHDYYDLSKEGMIRKQATLAKSYGLDGFIFYHYWFNGHKLFEKPIENFRDESEPIEGFHYSICWANENWSRTWDGRDHEVLLKQDYGDRDDWKNHIEYLATFFKDKKYQKIDGHPVLYIYSANQIDGFDEMIQSWNNYLESVGIPSIHLIEFMRARNNIPASAFSAGIIEFEPLYSIRYDISFFRKAQRYLCKVFNLIDYQDYDSIWRHIIKRNRLYEGKIIYKSGFVGWDNSPRKGRKNSIIIKNSTPRKFGQYLDRLVSSPRKGSSNDIVVLNAWNEWGEGAMLEPTEQEGFAYLEQVRLVKQKHQKGENQ